MLLNTAGILIIAFLVKVNSQPGFDYPGQRLDRECHDKPMTSHCTPGIPKVPKYFYDQATKTCKVYTDTCGFGGFYSQVDCYKSCVCRLPFETGHSCAGATPGQRYYYDSSFEACVRTHVFYKGCGGNGNNFLVIGLCKQMCRGQEVEREQILRQLGIPEHSYPEYNRQHHQPAPQPLPPQNHASATPPPVHHQQAHPVAPPPPLPPPQQPRWHPPPPQPTPYPTPPRPTYPPRYQYTNPPRATYPPTQQTYPPTPPPTAVPMRRRQRTRAWQQNSGRWNDNAPQRRRRKNRFGARRRGQQQQQFAGRNRRPQQWNNQKRQNQNRRRKRINQRQRRRKMRVTQPPPLDTTEPFSTTTELTTTTKAKDNLIYTFSLTNVKALPKMTKVKIGEKKKIVQDKPRINAKTVSNKTVKSKVSSGGSPKKTTNNARQSTKRPRANRRRRPRTTEPPYYDPTSTTSANFDSAYYGSSTTPAYDQGFNARTTTQAQRRLNGQNALGLKTTTVGNPSTSTDAFYY